MEETSEFSSTDLETTDVFVKLDRCLAGENPPAEFTQADWDNAIAFLDNFIL
jgi:hypothetical protein